MSAPANKIGRRKGEIGQMPVELRGRAGQGARGEHWQSCRGLWRLHFALRLVIGVVPPFPTPHLSALLLRSKSGVEARSLPFRRRRLWLAAACPPSRPHSLAVPAPSVLDKIGKIAGALSKESS